MIVNMTPHPIVVEKDDGSRVVYPPSGKVARIKATVSFVDSIEGVQIVENKYGIVVGLPEDADDVYYLVSPMVLATARARCDLLSPDTGPTAIRDENGYIEAVRRFVR